MESIMKATGTSWTKKAAQAMAALLPLLLSSVAFAGETDLVMPPLDSAKVTFFGSMTGYSLLGWGLVVCVLGILFGFAMFLRLRSLPVHQSFYGMRIGTEVTRESLAAKAAAAKAAAE